MLRENGQHVSVSPSRNDTMPRHVAEALRRTALGWLLAVAFHRLHHFQAVHERLVEPLLLLLLLNSDATATRARGGACEERRQAELAPDVVGLLGRLAEPDGIELPRLEREVGERGNRQVAQRLKLEPLERWRGICVVRRRGWQVSDCESGEGARWCST